MTNKRKAKEEPGGKPASPHASKRQATAEGAADPAPQLRHGFQSYPTSHVYRLIEPGPVVLVTTGSLEDGTHNIMTLGFHMVVQHDTPPLLAITLGPWNASFARLQRWRECVLAVPSVEMAAVAIDVGNCSAAAAAADDDDQDAPARGIGKWARFGLDALPAAAVAAPLVGGPHVIANIECVVEDASMVRRYALWLLKPVRAWVNPAKRPGAGGRMFHHRGDGTFVVDGEVLDLQARMTKWKEFQDGEKEREPWA